MIQRTGIADSAISADTGQAAVPELADGLTTPERRNRC